MMIVLNDIIDKISSYNILNYVIPGAIFWYLCPICCDITLPVDNIVGELIGFYFIGMVIYSIGSLLIEPVFRIIHAIHFTEYNQYVIASKDDSKLASLSESNNTFRTMIALCLSLIIIKLYCGIFSGFQPWLCLIGLFMLFSMAYVKRTIYINERVSAVLDELKSKNKNNVVQDESDDN